MIGRALREKAPLGSVDILSDYTIPMLSYKTIFVMTDNRSEDNEEVEIT